MAGRFVVVGLRTMAMLRRALLEAADRAVGTPKQGVADLIALSDLKILGSLVEFLVVFGLLPRLRPGLATPVLKRLPVAQARALAPVLQRMANRPRPPDAVQASALVAILTPLVRCLDHEGLWAAVHPKALPDMLVGLLQLGYQPSPPTPGPSTSTPSPTASNAADADREAAGGGERAGVAVASDESPRSLVDKVLAQQAAAVAAATAAKPVEATTALALLDEVLDGTGNVTPLLRATLTAGGGARQAPGWFRRGCSVLMAQILAKSGGVRGILSIMLRTDGDPDDSTNPSSPQGPTPSAGSTAKRGKPPPVWQQLERVAAMIAAFPSEVGFDKVAYSHAIAAQVLGLLRLDPEPHTVLLVRAAAVIIAKWLDAHPEAAAAHFARPLTAPLLAFTLPDRRRSDGSPRTGAGGHSASGAGTTSAAAVEGDLGSGRGSEEAQHGEGDEGDGGAMAPAIVLEEAIDRCIADLHALLINGAPGSGGTAASTAVLTLVRPVLLPLLRVHTAVQQTISHLKRPVQEILVAFFQRAPEREAAALFCQLLLPVRQRVGDRDLAQVGTSAPSASLQPRHSGGLLGGVGLGADDDTDLGVGEVGVATRYDGTLIVSDFEPYAYAPGPTGGVEMRQSTQAAPRDLQAEAEAVVALLGHIRRPSLPADAFAVLVEMYVNQTEAEAAVAAAGGELTPEEAARAALLLHVLVLMCEEHGPDIVRDTAKGLHIVQLMLRGPSVETMGLSLQLLLGMLQGIGQLCKEDARLLQGVLPSLEPLKSHPDPELAATASDIAVAIATRSLRWVDNDTGRTKGAGGARGKADPMEEIKRDLQDPLLPVRAHALGALRKLVLKKDPDTHLDVVRPRRFLCGCVCVALPASSCAPLFFLSPVRLLLCSLAPLPSATRSACVNCLPASPHSEQNLQDFLLGLFEAQLEHSDSYLYLSAINGLVALGDVYPTRTVPLLTRKFASATVRVEHRLKFAEALLKVARGCGEMLPAHRGLFLPAVLGATRDPTEVIRTSALATLGTLCELLRFSLQGVLHEILGCLTAIIQTDTTEPRRAAMLVFTQLLRGLKSDLFEVLADQLTPTSRVLRQVEESDPDEVVRHHAREALGELNAVVREFMQPGRKRPAGVFLPSQLDAQR